MLHRVLICAALVAAGTIGATTAIGCSSDSSPAGGGGGTDAGADTSTDATAMPDTGSVFEAGPDTDEDQMSVERASCNNLCDSIIAHCNAGDIEYTSKAACMATCAGVPIGTYGDMIDSVGCRQERADEGRINPTPQCEIAGPFGGGTCGDRCVAYCRVIAANCSGANVVYASTTACMADCGSAYKFDADAGFEYTNAGNTLNCREKQLLALVNDVGGASAATICPLLKSSSTACHN